MSEYRRWKLYNRKFLVEPFQLRLVGVAIFHFVLVIAVFAGALFVPLMIRLDGDIASPGVQAAAREFLVLHTRLWAPLFGAFVLLVLHNIVVSHRIAGPLWRLRRYLKAVGEGDLSEPIRFRRGDYLNKETEVVNATIGSLRDKLYEVEARVADANAAWQSLRSTLAGGAARELEAEIERVDRNLEACTSSVTVFKTGIERKPRPRPREEAVAEKVEV